MERSIQDVGIAVLRITMGAMFVAHGLLKLLVFTLPGTVGFFESVGLPGVLAYAVVLAEIGGGLLLILGWRTREISVVLLPILLGATWVHRENGWVFSNPNGGWEYPIFLAAALVALVFLGSGALALTRPYAVMSKQA